LAVTTTLVLEPKAQANCFIPPRENTRESISENELVSKAEHFEISAYDLDPTSGEEEQRFSAWIANN
jgi:hypothetical protein